MVIILKIEIRSTYCSLNNIENPSTMVMKKVCDQEYDRVPIYFPKQTQERDDAS